MFSFFAARRTARPSLRSTARSSLRSKARKHRVLGIEPLESRKMLAVTVGLDPGDSTHVLVTGDGNATTSA